MPCLTGTAKILQLAPPPSLILIPIPTSHMPEEIHNNVNCNLLDEASEVSVSRYLSAHIYAQHLTSSLLGIECMGTAVARRLSFTLCMAINGHITSLKYSSSIIAVMGLIIIAAEHAESNWRALSNASRRIFQPKAPRTRYSRQPRLPA
jgi:hypothetical protein